MEIGKTWVLGVAGGLLIAAGCGSSPPPTRAQTDAIAAVRSAEALDAESTPAAAYQLELARGQVREGETLMRRGEMDRARTALERAKADADLAVALRREAQARAAAEAAHEHIDTLRRETTESSGGEVPVAQNPAPAAQTTTTTTVTTTAP